MNTCDAAEALEKKGHKVDSIARIPEGANHYVFDVTLQNGTNAIAKFAATRYTEEGLVASGTDTLFGGRLTLDREAAIFDMTRNEAKLPAPMVYASHRCAGGDFLLLEKLEGTSFTKYLKNCHYSMNAFLKTMEYLGADIAKAQSVRFNSFGNIMARDEIEPSDIRNFADRFLGVTGMRLDLAGKKDCSPRKPWQK